MKEVFEVDDMVLYDGKDIAKVIQVHTGYELLTIRIYHKGFLWTTKTTISSSLCEKLLEK